MKPSLLFALFITASLPATAADMLVSPSWLKDNLDDPKLVLFHVGTKPEFDKEHIPGAQLVVPQDLSIPRADGALMIQMLPMDALKEKLRITKAPRPELLISAEEIQSSLGGKTLNIVDARLPEFFDGTNAGAMPRAGRITGARNIPFSSLATADLGLKSAPDLADLFRTAGVGAGDTVVSYCHTSQQATLVYFAAKRLGIKARVYDGSWDEWSRRSELPVETTPLK